MRTPLDRLDIDEATRKQLEAAGIHDVEAILETDPAELAKILDSDERARRLIEMAKAVLGSTPPAPPPKVRTDLSALGIDAATQRKLQSAGFADVEAVAAADPALLARALGDKAAASKLIEAARKLLATPTRPTAAPAPKRGATTRKTPKR